LQEFQLGFRVELNPHRFKRERRFSKTRSARTGFTLPSTISPVTSLRFFEPSAFGVGIGGTIEFSDERAEQFRLVFATQRPDPRFDLRHDARHRGFQRFQTHITNDG